MQLNKNQEQAIKKLLQHAPLLKFCEEKKLTGADVLTLTDLYIDMRKTSTPPTDLQKR